MKKLLCVILLICIKQVNAQLCFNPATNFTTGTSPQAITSNDFNGDGIIDIANTNVGSGNVSVLLGNGTGGFGAPAFFAVEAHPESICSADFNGDTFKDLVITYGGKDTISMLFGNGTGSFGAVTN